MEMILLNDIDKNNKSFENIKHIDENVIEFWYARELQTVLNYKEWRKFENVINKQKKHVKIVILVSLNILSTSTSCQNVLIMLKL